MINDIHRPDAGFSRRASPARRQHYGVLHTRKAALSVVLWVLGSGLATAQTLFVSSEADNAVYSVDLASGQRTTTISGALGLLSLPQALALDPLQGTVFVASAGNNSIIRYNPNTQTADVFASLGESDSPVGLAFDSGGNLFVSNFGAGNILRFARDTSGVLQSGSPTVFASDLSEPFHLAFGSDSSLYVASTVQSGGAELRRYSTTAGTAFGTYSIFSSAQASGLTAPTGLTFGANGTLYAANSVANNVVGFGPGGGVPQTVLAPASPAELSLPQGLAFSSSTSSLYVANYGIDNIIRINPATGEGTVVFEGINSPTGLLITAEIPEPSSGALGLLGAAGAGTIGWMRRRRRLRVHP